jgi:molecular chaperone DnaK
MPQIEVTFDIDADGILNVSAKDKATGKEQSIRIEASSGLNEEEIEKMRKAAREHAAEDKQRREAADQLNAADTLIFSTEKNLEDYGDKLPAEKRAKIDAALERLKEVHKNQNTDQLESAMEQLNAAWSEASEDIYKAQQEAAAGDGAPAGEPGAQPGAEPADEVKDVDFEVVDEDDTK